jgi:dihydroxyacetone kinase phosphoprotein-dependent L subunit
MNLNTFKKAVLYAAFDLSEREEELCRLDSVIGDGDHGMTIRKGFKNVMNVMNHKKTDNYHDFLFEVSLAFSDTAGGAIGPIFASLFLGMAAAVSADPKLPLDTRALYKMLSSGLIRVQDIGGAKPGDKTLVDTLLPAVKELEALQDRPLVFALDSMVSAAEKGMLSTKDMVAKKGRAHYLGDASLGHVDAGATSIYCFLRAFARSALQSGGTLG